MLVSTHFVAGGFLDGGEGMAALVKLMVPPTLKKKQVKKKQAKKKQAKKKQAKKKQANY